MILEFCIQSYSEALAARQYGAKRAELCSALETGGLTPSFGLIKQCAMLDQPEIHVLIRPRAGNFCYSAAEIEIMRTDIQSAKDAGAEGVAFGVLDEENNIDLDANAILVELSKSLKLHTTFHRAFDLIPDPITGIEQLIDLGFDRLLSSGQKANASEGVPLFYDLIECAEDRIEIMAGGGIDSSNVMDIIASGVNALHFSIGKAGQESDLGMGCSTKVDTEKVKAILEKLNGF